MSSNSVGSHTLDEQIGLPLCGRLILLITPKITDRIGLHSVLLPLLIVSDVSHAKEDCESVTAAGSRCPQNSKAENFTWSSGRLSSEMCLIRTAREERLPFLIQLII